MNKHALRVDSHQHFWNYAPSEYAWMSDAQSAIKRDFLPSDLAPLLDAIGFDGSIAVQARQSEDETRYLLAFAQAHAFVKGVVGWIDLCADDVSARLERYASEPKLKGMRHLIHDEPDVGFMLRPDFRRGLSRLSEHGLVYDLLLFPEHIPNAIKLVESLPEQPFVLDHLAKPLIKAQRLAPWEQDIRELARYENVTCKLSGMVTEAHWSAWQPDDLRPYLDTVFDAFGNDRLMIGSDWPVCTLGGEYQQVMSVVIDYVSGLPQATQDDVLGLNCARVYSL